MPENFFGAAEADARGAELQELAYLVEGGDAPRGLHRHAGRTLLAHQSNVLCGGAGRSEARRRLHPVHAGPRRDFAELELLVAGQVAVFEDELELLAPIVSELGQL